MRHDVAVPEFLNEFASLEDKVEGSIVPGTSPGIPLAEWNNRHDQAMLTGPRWRSCGTRRCSPLRIDIAARDLIQRWNKF